MDPPAPPAVSAMPQAADAADFPDGFALLAAELVALKRTARPAATHSLATAGCARALSRLAAGASADDVAWSEIVFGAAHVVLGPLDAAAMAAGGVDADDRAVVYARAAARTLGASRPQIDAAASALAGCQPPERTDFAHALALTMDGSAGEPAANLADHSYVVAVLAALLATHREAAPGEPFLLGVLHHGGEVAAAPPPALADAARACEARAFDLAHAPTAAFRAAHAVERLLERRQAVNEAGLSLGDAPGGLPAWDAADPLARYDADVVRRLGLAF